MDDITFVRSHWWLVSEGFSLSTANSDVQKLPALAGGDCIDDADALRAGGTAGVLGCAVKAPSTLGTFLRSFRWGHSVPSYCRFPRLCRLKCVKSSLQNQRLRLAGVDDAYIHQDIITGTVSHRPGLNGLLDAIQAGDVLN